LEVSKEMGMNFMFRFSYQIFNYSKVKNEQSSNQKTVIGKKSDRL